MSLYKRGDSRYWWINVQWRGCPRVHLSTLTHRRAEAKRLLATLHTLRAAGRTDLLGLIAAHRITLQDVHAAIHRDPRSVAYLRWEEPSPILGALVSEWIEWMKSPAGISSRTKRRFAPQTIRRYASSWEQVFAWLPEGREAKLTALTSGAIAAYRKARVEAGCDGPTVNRDLCAIQALLRYAEIEREISLTRPRLPKERESPGRERWLSAAEIARVARAAPTEWWPLFATLIYTGVRIGEAQALRWGDVLLTDRRIAIHGRYHRLKTVSSDRNVPIPDELAKLLAEHAFRVPSEPGDPLFPGRWAATRRR